MKTKKTEIIIIALILLLQTAVYIAYGNAKSYFHLDEAYSYGLTNYDRVQIYENQDFYNNWHKGEYYFDYLTINQDEKGDFDSVYQQQKNDVHPPFYYLFLRIAMEFNSEGFSKWSGLVLNIIFSLFLSVFVYLILKELLKNQVYHKEISALITFFTAIISSTLSNVMFIRMYVLVGLLIAVTVYLHLKLDSKENIDYKLLVCIGITALLGSLTHYYYLFYLGGLYLVMMIDFVRKKRYREAGYYTLTMILSACLSLGFFPHSLDHIFGGHRGKSALANLDNLSAMSNRVFDYLGELNKYTFHYMLFAVLGLVVALQIFNSKSERESKGFYIVTIPSAVYFILTSIASPWVELRYILPVSYLIFGAIICYCFVLLKNLIGEIKGVALTVLIMIIISVSPLYNNIEPQFIYGDYDGFTETVETQLNVPAVYYYNSQNCRFMDDIVLFSRLDNSYIAKDIQPDAQKISEIFSDMDLSDGCLVFINDGQDKDEFIKTTKSALGFENCVHIKRLVSADMYYFN